MIGFKYVGVGRKKSSISISCLKPGNGLIVVNNIPIFKYFKNLNLNNIYRVFKFLKYKLDFNINIKGGGFSSQFKSMEFSIISSVIDFNKSLKSDLKKSIKKITDSRVKERRKIGFVKSRKKKQFSKR
ncbi:30S ribosomal protein S9 [Candidatus Vidania fulgoroideorum]